MRKKFSGQEKQEILRRYKESGKTVALTQVTGTDAVKYPLF